MAYIITQSCCKDASCVYSRPENEDQPQDKLLDLWREFKFAHAASRRRLFLRGDGTGRGANELLTGTESLVGSQLTSCQKQPLNHTP